ncbi:hypothetical protein Tco_0679445 [Tanacetum coccineum]|uniref:Uncharacterized protein n=1 Tax=Tanacetum coccineum TaxID=301880 RepID=A0ABQ4XI05_9ASTR
MSCSTISYESIAESMGSSIASAMVPYPAPNDDSESEPFEDPASPVASDFDYAEPYFNSEPFLDCVSPTVSVASDPDDEPLGSPDTTDYYGGRRETVQGTRKTVRPQSNLSPSTLALIADWTAAPLVPSPPPSLLSPLSSPTDTITCLFWTILQEVLLFITIKFTPFIIPTSQELLPPRKRFTTMERIVTLEIEVKSLTAGLMEAEI